VKLHARSKQNRDVAICRFAFKSGRSGSKIGQYLQCRIHNLAHFAGRSAEDQALQLLAAFLHRREKAADFSAALCPSPHESGAVVPALALLVQPLTERSERLPRVPIDSTVSVTGARPEDPIARAPAGVRSMTRPRM